jgi:hypothetical protein
LVLADNNSLYIVSSDGLFKVKREYSQKPGESRRLIGLGVLLIAPALIVALGAVEAHSASEVSSTNFTWQHVLLGVMLCAQFGLCVLLAKRFSTGRILAVACVGFAFWLTLCCGFIASMSISGLWS